MSGIGISTGHDPYNRTLAQNTVNFDAIQAIGADTIRITCEWSTVEATEGVFDWTIPDELFDLADARNLEVLFILLGTPSWARTGGEPTNTYPPTDPSDFAPFCTAAAARYKSRGGGCHLWEVWNEPNSVFGFGTAPNTIPQYVALLNVAYTAIKAEDAASTIIVGGIAAGGIENSTGGINLDTLWLQEAYDAGITGNYDAIGYHPYAKGQDPANPTPTGEATGQNLVTNGTFDQNINNWFGDSAIISRVTSPVRSGSGALSIAMTGGQFSGAHFVTTISGVTPGTEYLAQAWVQASTPGDVTCTIRWYAADGSTIIGFFTGFATAATTTNWRLVTARATAPALAAFASTRINDPGLTPAGRTIFVDDVALNIASDTTDGWNRLGLMRSVMDANGDPGVPMWITEVGQATGTSALAVDEATQALYLQHAFDRWRGVSRLPRIYIHQDIDNGSNPAVESQNYGMSRADHSRKPAFDVFLTNTLFAPPGGGGFGALMSDAHFERYEVAGKWQRVKRVKIPTRS